MKKLIALCLFSTIMLSSAIGLIPISASTPTSFGPYDFSDYAPTDPSKAPTGFIALSSGTNYGLYSFNENDNTGLKIVSTAEKTGTGIFRVYPEVYTQGYIVDEFDIKLSDFDSERRIQVRSATSVTSGMNVAAIDLTGKLKIYNGSNSAYVDVATLVADNWYRIKIIYVIPDSKGQGTTAKTYVELYDNAGVLLGANSGLANCASASAVDTTGSVARFTLYHTTAAVATTTYIDNWSSQYVSDANWSADSGTKYSYYNDFYKDSTKGVNIADADIWRCASNVEKTMENGIFSVTNKRTDAANIELNLGNASDATYAYNAENSSVFKISADISFPDFLSDKKFITRNNSNSTSAYAIVSNTTGELCFPQNPTGVILALNTYYNFSYSYDMKNAYGYLVVTNKETNAVVYDSREAGASAQNITGTVARAGIAIATSSGEPYPGFVMDKYTIESLDSLEIPMTSITFDEEGKTQVKDYISTAIGSNNNAGDSLSINNGMLEIALKDDNYMYSKTNDISSVTSKDNYVIKTRIKLDSNTYGAELYGRTGGLDKSIWQQDNMATKYLKLDATTNTIYAFDLELSTVPVSNLKAAKAVQKPIGSCQRNTWYDVEITVCKSSSSYNVRVSSDGNEIAFGYGSIIEAGLSPQEYVMANGSSDITTPLENAIVYIDSIEYGQINTEELPTLVSTAIDGADILLKFDKCVNVTSFNDLVTGAVALSTDQKTVRLSWLLPQTKYDIDKNVLDFYGKSFNVLTSATTDTFDFRRSDLKLSCIDNSTARAIKDVASSTLKASIKTEATENHEVEGLKLIAAAYNGDNELLSINLVDLPITTALQTTDVSIDIPADAATAKAFIWYIGSAKPFINSSVIK